RIFREEIPGPRHGVRGRLVASKKERHRLIAELLIRHALTRGILGEDDVAEHIALILSACTALGDEALDHLFKLFDRVDLPPVARARPPTRRRNRKVDVLDEDLADVVHRLEDRALVVAHIGAKERSADDTEGEVVHILADIADGSILEVALDHLERLVKHHGRIRIDALAVEAGLNEIVLTAPMLAIIRDEAVAEEELPERLGEPA